MAKSKPVDLLAELDAIEKDAHYRSWMGKLSEPEQKVILDVRERWQAGHYTGKGIRKRQIYDFLKAKMPSLTVTLPIFRDWLNGKTS